MTSRPEVDCRPASEPSRHCGERPSPREGLRQAALCFRCAAGVTGQVRPVRHSRHPSDRFCPAPASGAVGAIDLDTCNPAVRESGRSGCPIGPRPFHPGPIQRAQCLEPNPAAVRSRRDWSRSRDAAGTRPRASMTAPTCASRCVSTPRITSGSGLYLSGAPLRREAVVKRYGWTGHSGCNTKLLSGHIAACDGMSN